jgi:hypothetical protein
MLPRVHPSLLGGTEGQPSPRRAANAGRRCIEIYIVGTEDLLSRTERLNDEQLKAKKLLAEIADGIEPVFRALGRTLAGDDGPAFQRPRGPAGEQSAQHGRTCAVDAGRGRPLLREVSQIEVSLLLLFLPKSSTPARLLADVTNNKDGRKKNDQNKHEKSEEPSK